MMDIFLMLMVTHLFVFLAGVRLGMDVKND